MTYKVEQVKDSEYVSLVYADKVTKKEHEEGRDEAAFVLSATGWQRLFVDASRIDAMMSAGDDLEFSSGHQFYHSPEVRIAVLHRPDELKRFKFIEAIARKQGSDLKVFTDRTQAIGWLIR